jgi:histidinol-phosphate aminotransferase
MNIEKMQRSSVKGLKPYDPGLLKNYRYKLDANENGYDVPAAAKKEILRRIAKIDFNRYPDPGCSALKELIAGKNGVKPSNIVMGNGSDEIIHYLIQAFTNTGDRVVIPDPTFEVYRILALANGAKPVMVPLDEKFDLDERAVLKASKGAKLIFIAYPNNPTGNCFSEDRIRRIIKGASCLVVLDEAYFQFSGRSFLPELRENKNLIILRTFSKAYSMAALRLGYLIADEKIATVINKVRLPYNINALSQAGAGVMMKLSTDRITGIILREKEMMYRLITETYPVVRSNANFLFIRVKDGKKAKKIFEKNGISIRIFTGGRLDNYIRLSIGTPQENRAALKILKRGV